MKNYRSLIGKRVTKVSGLGRNGQPLQPKPFKSGLKANTVKDVIEHPILKIPAFIFLEDDSYVECRRCKESNIPAQ